MTSRIGEYLGRCGVGLMLMALSACAASMSAASTDNAASVAGSPADGRVVPLVDHHQHLVSPSAASGDYPPLLAEVLLPADLTEFLALRQKAGSDAKALAPLFSEDAV